MSNQDRGHDATFRLIERFIDTLPSYSSVGQYERVTLLTETMGQVAAAGLKGTPGDFVTALSVLAALAVQTIEDTRKAQNQQAPNPKA